MLKPRRRKTERKLPLAPRSKGSEILRFTQNDNFCDSLWRLWFACRPNETMDWDAISAISQLIGSLAVASVLYLAVQVHQSTRVARLATQDAAATALRDVTKPLMENAELERIWRIGLEDISALSVEERARFFHAAYQFLKAFETIHFHYVYGLMDRELWEGWHGLSARLHLRVRHGALLETSAGSFLRALSKIRSLTRTTCRTTHRGHSV